MVAGIDKLKAHVVRVAQGTHPIDRVTSATVKERASTSVDPPRTAIGHAMQDRLHPSHYNYTPGLEYDLFLY